MVERDVAGIGCSTPFGITERACSRAVRNGRMPVEVCSAPFGITEGGISARRVEGLVQEIVLNAFRHHRGGHKSVRGRRVTRRRAQRLSASQRGAFDTRTDDRGCPGVLNAFRHHRGGHASRRAAPTTCRRALNAFRHHRGGHSSPFVTLYQWACAQRLSASQRGARLQLSGPNPQLLRAQRLSASQRGALAVQVRVRPHGKVLNAFRHHRGGHDDQGDRRPIRGCAQRLSASQRGAYQSRHGS